MKNPVTMTTIGVSLDKVTTVAQWRGKGVGWQTAVRRVAALTPVFVLRCDGSGTLFFADKGKVHTRSWRKVSITRRVST